MTVSIILPFYNAAPWMIETIASIQAQTYTHWELIAINDFSTDRSLELLTELAHSETRIRIVENQQKGIIPALQLGLSLATGEFLTRMDADDLMPENRLEWMVGLLRSLPGKSIVTGKVQYFSNKPVSEGYLSYENWLNERVDNNDYFDHIYRECVVASPNWLARRKEFAESNIFSKLNYPEDYDMTFRWLANGFFIQGMDKVTLKWREHPDRTSRNSKVYDQASFFELKLNWFCQLQELKSIAVLGAGTKGKRTADFFVKRGIQFNWFDLEWNNYGSPIYGNSIQNYGLLKSVDDESNPVKLLIAIYPTNKKPLLAFLNEKGFEIGKNAWFL